MKIKIFFFFTVILLKFFLVNTALAADPVATPLGTPTISFNGSKEWIKYDASFSVTGENLGSSYVITYAKLAPGNENWDINSDFDTSSVLSSEGGYENCTKIKGDSTNMEINCVALLPQFGQYVYRVSIARGSVTFNPLVPVYGLLQTAYSYAKPSEKSLDDVIYRGFTPVIKTAENPSSTTSSFNDSTNTITGKTSYTISDNDNFRLRLVKIVNDNPFIPVEMYNLRGEYVCSKNNSYEKNCDTKNSNEFEISLYGLPPGKFGYYFVNRESSLHSYYRSNLSEITIKNTPHPHFNLLKPGPNLADRNNIAVNSEGKADVNVKIAAYSVPKIPAGVNPRIQIRLGTAAVNNDGAKLCTFDQPVSPEITISNDGSDDTTPLLYENTFKDLPKGIYCVGLLAPNAQNPKNLIGAVITGTHEYFDETFSVGQPLPAGLMSLSDSANSNGCDPSKTGATPNTVYCFLQPIPGIGNEAGYLDVTKFGEYLNSIIKVVIGLMAVLAVLMLVIGGIEYMTSVAAGEKSAGKERMENAIKGLLLALASYVILYSINPHLVNFTGSIKGVDLEVSEEHYLVNQTSGGGEYTGGGTASNVTANITDFDVFLKQASLKYGYNCTKAKAFMYAESSGNQNATSPAGAKGLLQLMPSAWSLYGNGNIYNPADNIDAGVHYLADIQNKIGCNNKTSNSVCDSKTLIMQAAAYNGGPGSNGVSRDCDGITRWQCLWNDKAHTIPNSGPKSYEETRNYTQRVSNNYNALLSIGKCD